MDAMLESSNYIIEAAQAIDKMTESFLFEEGEEDNKSLASKAGGALKGAYDAMIKALKGFAEKIRETVSKLFMSAEAKTKFKEYEDFLKSNPATANEKATVKDFKKIDDAYMAAIQKANAKRKANADKSEAQKILGELDGVIKGASIVLGAGAIFKMLSSNKKVAEFTAQMMDKFSDELESTKNFIGKENYDKGKSKLEAQSNKSFWDRTIFGLMGKKKQNSESSIVEGWSILKSFIPGTGASKDKNKDAKNLEHLANINKNHPGVVNAGLRAKALAARTKNVFK